MGCSAFASIICLWGCTEPTPSPLPLSEGASVPCSEPGQFPLPHPCLKCLKCRLTQALTQVLALLPYCPYTTLIAGLICALNLGLLTCLGKVS